MTKLHRRRLRMASAPSTPLALTAAVAALLLAQFLAPATPASGQQDNGQPDLETGRGRFLKFCSACHHELGKIGPYLAGGAMYFVQAGLPAEQFGGLLTQQVRNGKPGSVMPKFSPDELSQGELDSIGLYLAVEGAALGGLDHANPPPPLTGSAEAGAVQYGRHCVVCHGPDAMGSEIVPPIALDAAGMKQGGLPPSALHGLLLLACRSGELEQMPIYSVKDLSDQQLADIAAWLWESAPEMP